MKILNKNIISAYAKAIIDMISNGGCTVETTKNIRDTLFALKEDWCDVTLEKYAQIGVLLDSAYYIASQLCTWNEALNWDSTEYLPFEHIMIELYAFGDK